MTPRVKKSCGISMGSSPPRVVMRIVEHKVKDKTQKKAPGYIDRELIAIYAKYLTSRYSVHDFL